jgi:hypothetical protein
MLHEDCYRKGSDGKEVSGQESRGAWRQTTFIETAIRKAILISNLNYVLISVEGHIQIFIDLEIFCYNNLCYRLQQ